MFIGLARDRICTGVAGVARLTLFLCRVACVAGGLFVRMKNWGGGEKDHLPENLAFDFPPP